MNKEQKILLLNQGGLTVEHRKHSRHWNLLDADGTLIAVTVYKKGAVAAGLAIVKARLQIETVSIIAA